MLVYFPEEKGKNTVKVWLVIMCDSFSRGGKMVKSLGKFSGRLDYVQDNH